MAIKTKKIMASYKVLKTIHEYCKEMFNEDVTFKQVQNELFLIEMGMNGIDKVLNQTITKLLKDEQANS